VVADVRWLRNLPNPLLFDAARRKVFDAWRKAGVPETFLDKWEITYQKSLWGEGCMPAGFPSTNCPLEGLIGVLKRLHTRGEQKDLLAFLDGVKDLLWNWSIDYTKACTGLFPNKQQRLALESADASNFYCCPETNKWVAAKRIDGKPSSKVDPDFARKMLTELASNRSKPPSPLPLPPPSAPCKDPSPPKKLFISQVQRRFVPMATNTYSI
jgi:hypothetical protein